MAGPEKAHRVSIAMYPVIDKVIDHEESDPDKGIVRRQVKWRDLRHQPEGCKADSKLADCRYPIAHKSRRE